MNRTPTLVWTASSGAATYRVQVSSSSGFGTTVYDNAAIGGTSVRLPRLGQRVTWFWHVRAANANGASGYSATSRFVVRN